MSRGGEQHNRNARRASRKRGHDDLADRVDKNDAGHFGGERSARGPDVEDRVEGNYWGNDLDRYAQSRKRGKHSGASSRDTRMDDRESYTDARERNMRPESNHGYRGLGPRNYTRSDDRIHENICDALYDDADVDASDIDVKVAAGEVVLNGTVADRRQRWIAEDCVDSVAGVHHIQNNLRVRNRARTTGSDPGTVSGMFGSSAGRGKSE